MDNRLNITLHNYSRCIISTIRGKDMHIYIYTYNRYFFFILRFTESNANFNDSNTRWSWHNKIITTPNIKFLLKEQKNGEKHPWLQKKLKIFNHQFYRCNSAKIKFAGKGYKIRKNTTKSLILLFNRGHLTIFWWTSILLRRLRKYKIYIKFTEVNFLIAQTITKTRTVNIFTKRGLRQSRQKIFKKKGKK